MNDWPKVRLGDVCERVCSGGTPSASNETFYNGNIPWLNTNEVNFNNIYTTAKTITELGLKASAAKYIPENTIVVAMYGATAGKVAITKIPLTTNQACCNLIINGQKADYRFVFYCLKLQSNQLNKLANGGAQQNLNSIIIKKYPIPLPPLPIQHAIAKRLSAYDELIENNTRRIAILENKAEQLYKEWFVRRRKSVEKASKESWCNYSIKELCHINHDTISAKASGSILYLDTSSITGNKIATLESYDLRSAPGRARRKVRRNSIVYSIVRPNLKHHGIIKDAPANLIVSTGFAVLDAKHDIANVIYLFLSSQEVVDYCQMIAEGAVATYPSIRPEDIGKLKMALPSIAEAEKWNRELEPLFTLASNLQRQNALLAKERDLLLPRLMSGRLKP